MNYSYVMGVENVDELRDAGFEINEIDGDFGVVFPDDKIELFEDFIVKNLSNGFWNEHLGDEKVFIFKFEDGHTERFVLDDSNEAEVLALCDKFAETEFGSIDAALRGNRFYLERYFGE